MFFYVFLLLPSPHSHSVAIYDEVTLFSCSNPVSYFYACTPTNTLDNKHQLYIRILPIAEGFSQCPPSLACLTKSSSKWMLNHRCCTSMMSIQLLQLWRNKWMTFDPVPLCTVSEMGIHLRWTILDCDGALKDSAGGAWSSGRCVSSVESVSNMLEQNDTSWWWKNMKWHCCSHDDFSTLISTCSYCTVLHVKV